MAQEFTDDEIRQWLKENESQIVAVLKGTGNFLGRSTTDLDRYREKLEADVETNAKNWKNWRENYTAVMQDFHERAKNYTNLISIAGYAGFFWLWDKVSPIMSPIYFTTTGLCLAVSLIFFVFSEVFLMALTGLGELAETKTPNKPRSLNEEITCFEKERHRFNRINNITWKWHFFPAAITGLLGAFILLTFLIHGIIDGGFPLSSPN